MPAAWKMGASAMMYAPIAAYPVTGHVEELESHFGPSTDSTTLNAGICLDSCSSGDVVQPFQTAPWGNSTRLLCAVQQGNLWLFCCHNLCRQRHYAPSKLELVAVSGLRCCSSYNPESASDSGWSLSAFSERTCSRTGAVHRPCGRMYGHEN